MGMQQLAYLSHCRWQCRRNYHCLAYHDGLKGKTSCSTSAPTVMSRRRSAPPGNRSRCANPHSWVCGTAPPHTTRGFVPCSFSDAGPSACGETFMGPASEKLNKSGAAIPALAVLASHCLGG